MSTKPPRENLVRTMSEPPELDRATEGDMPTLRGHFAVWDSWTEINSAFEGRFMERFAPSSMTKTLSEGRDNMRVLFQHGRDPQIGDKPLGPIARLEPDTTGAFYEVPMLDTAYNRELIPGLEANLYGASFRFEVISEEFVTKPARSEHNPLGLPERTVTEARVREFGPVTFPAYGGATAGLRSDTDRDRLELLLEQPERLAELLQERTTVESDPPEDTTPPDTEPEPSVVTTRDEPGAPPTTTRFKTREEWLEWTSRV